MLPFVSLTCLYFGRSRLACLISVEMNINDEGGVVKQHCLLKCTLVGFLTIEVVQDIQDTVVRMEVHLNMIGIIENLDYLNSMSAI